MKQADQQDGRTSMKVTSIRPLLDADGSPEASWVTLEDGTGYRVPVPPADLTEQDTVHAYEDLLAAAAVALEDAPAVLGVELAPDAERVATKVEALKGEKAPGPGEPGAEQAEAKS